jgi:hypothetical protein
MLWGAVFALGLSRPLGTPGFLMLVLFQFFVPGLVLGASFGLVKRPCTEIIVYSFIISYLVFLAATLPSLVMRISWPVFTGMNIFLYLLVLAVFFVRCRRETGELPKPEPLELLVAALGILVMATYSYINYRNDATYYNHIISASLQSPYLENKIWIWNFSSGGQLVREPVNLFQLNYVQYFNFLAFPLKTSAYDQRYAWLLYHKLFCFLSMLSIYSFGRRLLNAACGTLSLFLYMITVLLLGFYYYYPSGEMGLLFLQAAHAKQVTQYILLFAFYSTLITAFRDNRRNTFLFAGAILLAMLTIHQLSFVYGVFSFVMFGILVPVFARRGTRGMRREIYALLKKGLYVMLLPAVYLIYLLIGSGYYKEIMYYHTVYSKSQWDDPDAMAIKSWGIGDKLKSLLGRAKVLIDVSVPAGVLFWGRAWIRKRPNIYLEFGSLFLLSNLALYLLLKFPLFNLLTRLDFSTGRYIDSLFLSYCIPAFIIASFFDGGKLRMSMRGFNCAVIGLTAVLYILFGTNN